MRHAILPLKWSRLSAELLVMKAKMKKSKAEVPFDPVLFAATVPGRKPTPKDVADGKEHKDDAVEPQQYDSMEDMVRELTMT